MNRRERFQRIVNFQEADRVPIDLGSHVASIHRHTYARLAQAHPALNLQNQDLVLDRMVQNVVPDERLLQRLGVDFRWIAPRWVGVEEAANGVYRDMWGIEWQYMLDAFSVMRSPLRDAVTIADLDRHPWPDPADPDLVRGLGDRARQLFADTDYVLVADAIKGGLLTKALQIRGYERFFADMVNNPDFAAALLDRLLDLYQRFWTHFLREVGRYVDVVYFTDDIGGQSALMISPHTFRALLKPRLATLINHIKSLADVKFMYHTDGTITPVLDDIVEMGVDILNPIQTSAVGMETAALKAQYHGKLVFHGAIDVQQMLPFATPDEVRYDVARRLFDLAPGGGYILAPCHNIGSDVPIENVFAMYDAARELGTYPIAVDHILRPEHRRGPTTVLEQAPKHGSAGQRRSRRPRTGRT